MKLSYEPAVTATVTAGIATAAAVGAALNAADMPTGWGWMETWVPVGIFLVYLLVGLVIRPLVIPAAKAKDAAAAERLTAVRPANPLPPIRSNRSSGMSTAKTQHVGTVDVPAPPSGNWTTGGYSRGDPPPPPT